VLNYAQALQGGANVVPSSPIASTSPPPLGLASMGTTAGDLVDALVDTSHTPTPQTPTEGRVSQLIIIPSSPFPSRFPCVDYVFTRSFLPRSTPLSLSMSSALSLLRSFLIAYDVVHISPPSDPLLKKAEQSNDGTQKPLRGVLELPEGVFARAQKNIQKETVLKLFLTFLSITTFGSHKVFFRPNLA
jgi:hypothetical protein